MSPLSSNLLVSRHNRDYSPVPWTHYFDEAFDIEVNGNSDNSPNKNVNRNDSFRVYLRNFCPPYAPHREFGMKIETRTSDASEKELNEYSKIPTLVTLHGGGYSALSWAQFTHFITQQCQCRILSIDLRSHGDTKTNDDDRMDIDTLVNDVIHVTHEAHQICGFPETPKLILVGHSMGGAIAIKCATKCEEFLPSLSGFIIIDVVEGTAKEALPLMMSVIKTRPPKFPSLSNAIEWSVRSGMAKNSDAARVSMPGNLLNIKTGNLAIHDFDEHPTNLAAKNSHLREKIKKHTFHINIENMLTSPSFRSTIALPRDLPLPPRITSLKQSANQAIVDSVQSSSIASNLRGGCISELQESTEDAIPESCDTKVCSSIIDKDGYKLPPQPDTSGYCWRTDLAKTQSHWNGWFDGLSEQLLAAPVPGKFLLLAGIDRLDKTLTIGQMQGKFMMKVLPKCGHAVHEDVPDQVASVIAQFLVRHKFSTPIVDH